MVRAGKRFLSFNQNWIDGTPVLGVLYLWTPSTKRHLNARDTPSTGVDRWCHKQTLKFNFLNPGH